MCGLAGEFRRDGSRADVSAVERMAATMSDRGPDDSGVWSQGPTALGHRRLKIIDLSAASGQPIVDAAAGLTGVFNGCIYNYRELRAELQAKGHRFFSSGDSEVVLKAYAEWGTRLRRPPASACSRWRSASATPAAWCWPATASASSRSTWPRRPGVVRFASTLPALLAGGGIDTTIDPVALAPLPELPQHRAAAAHHPRRRPKLPPATVRVYEADGSSHERVLLGPVVRPRRRAGRLVRAGLAGRAARTR